MTDQQTNALRRWYSRPGPVQQMKLFAEKESWEELEEFIQMICLMPLSRHDELPDYMVDDEGKPLFPTNLNPRRDVEAWQDAVEVGWAVVEEQLGVTHDEIHLKIKSEQEKDWEAFMKSVEQRKKERGLE